MNQDPHETPWQPWQGKEPKTVAGLLRHHLEHRPDALAYRFLTGTDTGRADAGSTEEAEKAEEGTSWNYRELDLRTRAVAALLQREGLTGKPVLLLHPPGLDYIAGFLGCLYAGAVAVPAYPPDTRRFGQTMPRLAAIARDSGATHALTTEALSRFAATKRREMDSLGLAGLRWLALSELGTDGADTWHEPVVGSDATAFLQYTSGSTSSPKGVMVSNGNLLHNLRSIHRRLEHDAGSGMVSWLPPYHDMGLIGGILTPLYGGFPAHLMSAMSFVRQPLLWLETLSRTRASTSVAPNFGFEHCVRRITDEQRDGLDLSHWRLALNGAEPVRADTLDQFTERFAACGFERRALLPCYGLAEATLMVTGVGAHEPPPVGAFASAALGAGVAEPVPDAAVPDTAVPDAAVPDAATPEAAGARSGRAVRLVGCGPAVDGVDVAVVDPDTRRRIDSEGHIGEIWIAGGSVAHGYWGRPEASEATFRARIEGEGPTPFLRTGDLGFLKGGHLHVVGRIKDVVIVQGRNHYPQDVELTVERADEAVRAGSGAAFSIEVAGAEELVVVHEVESRRLDGAPALLAKLRAAIAEEHDVTPHAVVLLKRSTVHRTTSGKIQRQACKRDFLGLGLTVVAASVTRDPATPLPAGASPACPPPGAGSGWWTRSPRS